MQQQCYNYWSLTHHAAAPVRGFPDRWQKRWFEAVGHYLTYYKTHDSDKLLACIDLRQVGEIKMVPDGIVGGKRCASHYVLHSREVLILRAAQRRLPSSVCNWVTEPTS